MKKSVLLLALSFVFVAFINAQTDCNSFTSASKAEKEILVSSSETNAFNLLDCAKSGTTDNYYRTDAFIVLMYNKPLTKPVEDWGGLSLKPDLRSGDVNFNPDPVSIFSTSKQTDCCSHSGNVKQNNPARDH